MVVFSPWAPSENGIATYVGELMPYHLAEFDVTLVIADDAPLPPDTKTGPRILFASEFKRHRLFFESVPKLYHIGNNPDHSHMLDFLVRDPGLVVLHDFNLNYMHDAYTLGWREKRGYASVLQSEYGLLGAGDARWNFEKADRGLFATYTLTLTGDVLEAATGVIAHSRYVQYKVAARAPRIPVWHVPHHLSPTVNGYQGLTKQQARQELGLPANEILVTALGFITYAKRIPLLLSALSKLRSRVPPFRLILAGQRKPTEYDVDRDIAASGLGDITLCTDYIDEDSFFKHLAACDIVSNLRHPSGGETSGTLIRALGMGAPTVVLDTGPFGELPEGVVRKVSWSDQTDEALTKVLGELMTDPAGRQALGNKAKNYVQEAHGIEKVAAHYAKIVRQTSKSQMQAEHRPSARYFPSSRETAQRVRDFGDIARANARAADGALWWRASTIPLGQKERRALVVSTRPEETAQLLSDLFLWPRAAVTAMTDVKFLSPEVREKEGTPTPAKSFSLALAIIQSDLPEDRACLLLRRLNASLLRGGQLVIELVSGSQTAADNFCLGETALYQRLTDAGFAHIRHIAAHDGFFADLPIPEYDETVEYQFSCFTSRKVSDFSMWQFTDSINGLPFRLGGRIA